MSLGRLLAAGKSLVGGQDLAGRYRVNKHIALPKFVSPRNPFAPASKTDVSSDDVESSDHAQAEKAVVGTARADAGRTGKNDSRISMGPRATRWLGALRQKLNPLQRLAKRPGPAKSAVACFATTPVQPELSLDQVKVIRNDLSDADLEVVPVKAPVATGSAKPQEKFALVGSTWDRLATRILGAGPT